MTSDSTHVPTPDAPKRQTRQRDAVLSMLQSSGRPLSPQEILHGAQQDVPQISLSTVYRQLKDLLQREAVTQVDLPGQPPRFEAPCAAAAQDPEHHHHHFHCTDCERVFSIDACPGPMDALAPPGFEVIRHDVVLHGHCAECAAGRP